MTDKKNSDHLTQNLQKWIGSFVILLMEIFNGFYLVFLKYPEISTNEKIWNQRENLTKYFQPKFVKADKTESDKNWVIRPNWEIRQSWEIYKSIESVKTKKSVKNWEISQKLRNQSKAEKSVKSWEISHIWEIRQNWEIMQNWEIRQKLINHWEISQNWDIK